MSPWLSNVNCHSLEKYCNRYQCWVTVSAVLTGAVLLVCSIFHQLSSFPLFILLPCRSCCAVKTAIWRVMLIHIVMHANRFSSAISFIRNGFCHFCKADYECMLYNMQTCAACASLVALMSWCTKCWRCVKTQCTWRRAGKQECETIECTLTYSCQS